MRWAAIASAWKKVVDVRRPERSADARLSSRAAGPKNWAAAGSGSDPAGGHGAEEARRTWRKVTRRAAMTGVLAPGAGVVSGGVPAWGGASAAGASWAEAAGGREVARRRGRCGGERST